MTDESRTDREHARINATIAGQSTFVLSLRRACALGYLGALAVGTKHEGGFVVMDRNLYATRHGSPVLSEVAEDAPWFDSFREACEFALALRIAYDESCEPARPERLPMSGYVMERARKIMSERYRDIAEHAFEQIGKRRAEAE